MRVPPRPASRPIVGRLACVASRLRKADAAAGLVQSASRSSA